MKKILLFLSGALLSLGAFAQEEYYVTVDNFDFVIGGENNVDITSQLGGAMLKKGDWIIVTIKGYFNEDIRGVNMTAVVDNSEAAGYWTELSEWKTKKYGAETAALTLFEAEGDFELVNDAVSADKIVIRMDPLSDAEMVKMRPTATFVEGAKYEASMPTAKFSVDGTNYKAEYLFSTESTLVAEDIVNVTIDGTFNQDVDGLNFMIFDNDGATVLEWTARPFSATAGEKVTASFELTIPSLSATASKFTGTDYKVSVFIAGYDEENPMEVKFLKDGDVEHDAVKLASKEYTNITLSANVWDAGSNYQYVEPIASDVFAGDYVTFSINGVCDQEVAGLQAYLMNDLYAAISAYIPVQSSIAKDGTVEFSGKLEVSSASATCKLVIVTTDAVAAGIDAINIKVGGTTPVDPTAVEEVSASLAVQGGMVYSAGEIVVYNVAGKVVATASQALNVNSLNAGVYFIVAQEGTIKYVK